MCTEKTNPAHDDRIDPRKQELKTYIAVVETRTDERLSIDTIDIETDTPRS